MKILYIGSERSDAQVVATALRSLAETVSVLWAAHLDQAIKGLDENRDLAALVVDIQVSEGTWPTVLSHARSLASHPAIVAILPDGTDTALPGVDGHVRRNHTLPRDLPIAVTRAIEHAARVDLEQKLTYATSALEQAEQRRRTAADQLAALEAQYEVGMARAAATWEMVDEQLRTAALEVERARQSQAAAAGDVDRLTRRDGELSTQLAEATATRAAFERRLAEAEHTVEAVTARAEREQASISEQLADRQRTFDIQIAQEIERRLTIETSLNRTVTARDEAQKRHALGMSDAAARSRELQEDLRVARQEAASKVAELDRLITRESELSSTLADVTGRRQDLERRLAATQAAFDDATTRMTRERLALSKKTAEREAELEHRLQEESSAREAAERQLANDTNAIREATTRQDALEEQIQQARAVRAALEQTIADGNVDRDRLAGQLNDTSAALDRVRQDYESAAADVERLTQRETELTSQLGDVQDSRDTLERQLAGAEIALNEAQRQYDANAAEAERLAEQAEDLAAQLSGERAENTALERQLTDAADAIRDAAERHNTLEHEIQQERTRRSELEQILDDTRASAFERESRFTAQIAQEKLEHETHVTESEERRHTLTTERDTLLRDLSTVSDEVQQLRQDMAASLEQLEASRLESDRLFDQAGVAMFRCTRDGALTEVNRACATLIGRRRVDERAGIDFADAVFEDPNVLSWLIERCVTSRAKESTETTWRRQDGSRLFMRLYARSCSGSIVEVVAEDLTRLRVLEERLARAQRMEAVGRFAQEVAVTCGALLESLHQKGRDWLAAAGNADSRFEGQRLFDDIGRAAGLLRELAKCGDEQARTPMQVDLNTLIRDLEPVLKRVAGSEVEVQLRDTSSPLNVDVGTERVERLLVNLASYGRGRMPSGGRLRIELGTSVVDRRFAAKHPNVRLGLHALITVTETGHPAGADAPQEKPAAKAGVDFGTLQELVSECGGHLWMKVQPPGDMVAKIRLPLTSANEQTVSRPATRGARSRTAARWFQT